MKKCLVGSPYPSEQAFGEGNTKICTYIYAITVLVMSEQASHMLRMIETTVQLHV